MKRSIFALLSAGLLSIGLLSGAAVAATQQEYAQALQQAGMLLGDEHGDLMLTSPSTRAQGLVMLLRLTGHEQEARQCTASIPYTDVPQWVRPYVAYAHQEGLTAGISETQFAPDMEMSFDMYLAFLLRSLGYTESAGDFAYTQVQQAAAQLGLIHETDDVSGYQKQFLRSALAEYSFRTLFLSMKGSPSLSLAEQMAADGRLDVDTAIQNDLFAAWYNKVLAD
ncbi:MAG: S-layer homology domain-containing protein [Eubacteriales bacterium]|jgi:hypothetical protein